VHQGANVFRIARDREYWALMLPALQEFWVYLNQPVNATIRPPATHANSTELSNRSKRMHWDTPPELE
jgi:hypothetical protein